MDSIWIGVAILALLAAAVLLAVYQLRTRGAPAGHAAPDLKYVVGDVPGATLADSEESLRAREQLPRL